MAFSHHHEKNGDNGNTGCNEKNDDGGVDDENMDNGEYQTYRPRLFILPILPPNQCFERLPTH